MNPADYYRIDYPAIRNLPRPDALALLEQISRDITSANGTERARIVAAEVEEQAQAHGTHGAQRRAARALDMTPARLGQLYTDHKEHTMTTTTEYGTWTTEVNTYERGPETVVRNFFPDSEPDNFDDIVAAYRDAINKALPDDVTLAGDAFIGPAGEQDFFGYPVDEYGALDIGEIVRDVDLGEIIEKCDAEQQDTPVVTSDHVRELYEAQQQRTPSPIGHTDNMQPVLVIWDGAVEVMIETTALAHGLRVLYTSEQLADWIDGTDLQPGDADTIAAEVTAEIRRTT